MNLSARSVVLKSGQVSRPARTIVLVQFEQLKATYGANFIAPPTEVTEIPQEPVDVQNPLTFHLNSVLEIFGLRPKKL